MKKLSVLIISIVCFVFTGNTQELSSVKAQLDAMFSGLDKSRVPTGFLWDVSVNLVDPEEYDGSELTDSNYVDYPKLKDMISSLNSASVWTDTLNAVTILNNIQENSTGQSIQLGVLFKRYNRISANAISDNLINYSSGIVSDKFINGIWQNPYIEDVLFGFVPGNDGVVYQSVYFTLTDIGTSNLWENACIQFDAGDGNGYQDINFETPFHVLYDSTGYKEIKLKIVNNDDIYVSHSLIQVCRHTLHPAVAPLQKIDTTTFQAEYNGSIYLAKVSYLKTASFDNPLIVSEGFDPWVLCPKVVDEYTHEYSGFTTIKDVLAVTTPNTISGKDVFYIDWYENGADIRANAKLLEEVIKWVNENKTSGEKNVVLGQSMGGLIARYCLRDMELRGVPHDTKLFISHDAPHLGANVSPGLMFAYWDLHKLLSPSAGIFSLFNKTRYVVPELLRLGYYKSVRQMLPLYVNPSGEYDSSDYDELQAELSQMGFPQGYLGCPLENVAIVNGGKTDSGASSLFTGNDKLVHANLTASTGIWTELLLLITELNGGALWIPGRSTLHMAYDVYPYLSHSSLVRSFDLVYEKKFLWCIPILFDLVHERDYAPATGPCYDAVPSSYYEFRNVIDTLNYNNNNNLPSSLIGTVDFDFYCTDKIAFIPSASAFCYPDYNRDYYITGVSPRSQTPFDSYIVNNNHSYHTTFWDSVDNWLRNVEAEILVPPVVFSGDTLSVGSFIWSSSEPTVATVNNGMVTRMSDGIVEFTATYDSPGQVISKTRKAIVGYPQVSLKSEPVNGDDSIVTIDSEPEERELISEALRKGILTCKWGLKYSDGSSITWQTSQTDTMLVSIPDTLSNVSVYLKWQHSGELDSDPVEIQVLRSHVYGENISMIRTNPVYGIMYINKPFPLQSAITNEYGHLCLCFVSQVRAGLPSITSISVGSNTYSVSGTKYYTFPERPGVATTRLIIYIFDVLRDEAFQDTFLYNQHFIDYGSCTLDIILNSSDGPFQRTQILCKNGF